MITPATGPDRGVAAFRMKLLAGMALVVVALTVTGLSIVERKVSAETQHDLQIAFAAELRLVHTVRDIRHTSLAELCRVLVRKPRIHAALEDNALDMLYPSAGDELGDLLADKAPPSEVSERHSIHASFYRFLDAEGAVIPPANAPGVGALEADEEKRLASAGVPHEQQTGYLWRKVGSAAGEVVEVISTPIISTENGDAIAALVTGFPPSGDNARAADMQSGIWLDGRLHMPSVADPIRTASSAEVQRTIARGAESTVQGIPVRTRGGEYLIFFERLNPGSSFPPAYEVGAYSLAGLHARQWQLRWQAAAVGLLLLGVGIAASSYLSARLALPVRQLAIVSEENRLLRERAENALQIISEELQRTARFSADASHQLKTPVTVMRAGLDELLAREEISHAVREELSLLVHQTYRITSIIEDLLLLSRLDSGRLQPELFPVNLTHIVDTCVDDLHLLNDSLDLEVETDVPPGLHISGEKRYSLLIVQNLVENAHKYNLPHGRIRIAAREENGTVLLTVGNNAHPIPPASWEHIFERFHRAEVGENVPGHGLGLNVARELARLHGGDLRLVRSDEEWTEFEVRFCAAQVLESSRATA